MQPVVVSTTPLRALSDEEVSQNIAYLASKLGCGVSLLQSPLFVVGYPGDTAQELIDAIATARQTGEWPAIAARNR